MELRHRIGTAILGVPSLPVNRFRTRKCAVAAWATGQPCTTMRLISNMRPPTERYDVPRRPSFAEALARNPIEWSGLHCVNNVSRNYN